MEHSDEWCLVCGSYKGECNHDKERVTDDPAQAMRTRMIYKGIIIEPGDLGDGS